ncbi:hypothetical protein FO519_008581, partial [Halicephalobus sp. NKZ332]
MKNPSLFFPLRISLTFPIRSHLRDHVLFGNCILSGATLIVRILEELREKFSSDSVILKDLFFLDFVEFESNSIFLDLFIDGRKKTIEVVKDLETKIVFGKYSIEPEDEVEGLRGCCSTVKDAEGRHSRDYCRLEKDAETEDFRDYCRTLGDSESKDTPVEYCKKEFYDRFQIKRSEEMEIVIRSAACRLPGGINSLQDLSEFLSKGKCSDTKIPAGRIPNRNIFAKGIYGKVLDGGNFLDEDVDEFDPGFFNITKLEAKSMDPQQRILLEVVWECFENAGIKNYSDVGFFVGQMGSEFSESRSRSEKPTALDITGGANSVLAGRLNYFFDSQGPSESIDTACSSSLVALQNAVDCIKLGRCKRAVVAGTSLIFGETGLAQRIAGNLLSSDGSCKTFDVDADGYETGMASDEKISEFLTSNGFTGISIEEGLEALDFVIEENVERIMVGKMDWEKVFKVRKDLKSIVKLDNEDLEDDLGSGRNLSYTEHTLKSLDFGQTKMSNLDPENFYRTMSKRGVEYGTSMKVLEKIKRSFNKAISTVSLGNGNPKWTLIEEYVRRNTLPSEVITTDDENDNNDFEENRIENSRRNSSLSETISTDDEIDGDNQGKNKFENFRRNAFSSDVNFTDDESDHEKNKSERFKDFKEFKEHIKSIKIIRSRNNTLTYTETNYEKIEFSPQDQKSGIFIIGYACEFAEPCGNVEKFWEYMTSGSTNVPKYSDLKHFSNLPKPKLLGSDPAFFDPFEFNITPREALFMDPQQRLLLKTVKEALKNSKIEHLPENTGVFIGSSSSDFSNACFSEFFLISEKYPHEKNYLTSGTNQSCLSGRISHWLKLSGPSITVDTGCSSFGTAFVQASECLKNKKIKFAIVGGVNFILNSETTVVLERSKMLSLEGKCSVFDVDADGYCRSEGVAVVILSTEKNSEIEIVGWEIGHNANSAALTVPNGRSQVKILTSALQMAGNPKIDVFECHGSGTKIGDPIEVESILNSCYNNPSTIILTGTKAHVGHSEACSGGVSLVAVCEMMKENQVPGQKNFKLLNPKIRSLKNSDKIYIPVINEEHEINTAVINNFGFSGTNISIVLKKNQGCEKCQKQGDQRCQRCRKYEIKNKICKLILLTSDDDEDLKNTVVLLKKKMHQDYSILLDLPVISKIGRSGRKTAAILVNFLTPEFPTDIIEKEPRIEAIFHCAGVVENGTIDNITVSKFEKISEAKIEGTKNLLKLCKELKCLNIFVAMSSVSSIFGSFGQVNYSWGSGIMEDLIRAEEGSFKKLVLFLGPLGDVGMLSGNTLKSIRNQIESGGWRMLDKETVKLALRELINKEGRFVIFDGDFEKIVDQREGLRTILEDFVEKPGKVRNERHKGVRFREEKPKRLNSAGILSEEEISKFDYSSFNLSLQDMKSIDPQILLLLKHAHLVLEDSGYSKKKDKLNIGCYCSCEPSDFPLGNTESDLHRDAVKSDFLTKMYFKNPQNFGSSWISYLLDLNGPSMNIYSACSSSLVAIHQAIHELREGKVDLILVAASHVLNPNSKNNFSGMALAKEDCCRPFDKNASGIVPGSFAGVLLLKRLDKSIEDGDHIQGIIKGVGISNDGFEKSNFMAPGQNGQILAIRRAFEDAEVRPQDIQYIECHATGTAIGDQIEIGSILKTYSNYEGRLFLGSLKANLGHCFAAAGLAGIIKVLGMMKKEEIPGQINLSEPWDEIESSGFLEITKENQHLDPEKLFAVNAFGIGGTDACVILETYCNQKKGEESRKSKYGKYQKNQEIQKTEKYEKYENTPKHQKSGNNFYILPISGKTPESCLKNVETITEFLKGNRNLEDVSKTLQKYREHFPYRVAVIAKNPEEAVYLLSKITKNEILKSSGDLTSRNICFFFSPQGIQYTEMLKEVDFENDPEMREKFIFLAKIASDELGRNFDEIQKSENLIELPEFSQTALFVAVILISEALENFGVNPDAVLGHSVGEYAALSFCKSISAGDTVRLLSRRGLLMARTPEAKMLSFRDPNSLVTSLSEGIEISAHLSGSIKVVVGLPEKVDFFASYLKSLKIDFRFLRTSRGFHSSMMNPILPEFDKVLQQFYFKSSSKKVISNLDGRILDLEKLNFEKEYFLQHLRNPVRMDKSLDTLLKENDIKVMVEVGPPGMLQNLLLQRSRKDIKVVRTLQTKDQAKTSPKDYPFILEVLSECWKSGITVDFDRIQKKGKEVQGLLEYQFDEIIIHEMTIEKEEEDFCVETRTENVPLETTESQKENYLELQKIWSECLSSKIPIKDDSDFFELGGNSLNGVQICWRIEEEFKISANVSTLFDFPKFSDFYKRTFSIFEKKDSKINPLGLLNIEKIEFPLSYPQEQMFLLYHLEPGTHYNIVFSIKFKSENPEKFSTKSANFAISELVRKQTSLRTIFYLQKDKNEYVQQILQVDIVMRNFDLDWKFLSHDEIKREIEKEKNSKFEIEDSAFRVRTFSTREKGEEVHIMVVSQHHIVTDGWSMTIFADEFSKYYSEYLKGENNIQYPKNCVQYVDFAIEITQETNNRIFDFSVTIDEIEEEKTRLLIDWRKDLFDEDTVRSFADDLMEEMRIIGSEELMTGKLEIIRDTVDELRDDNIIEDIIDDEIKDVQVIDIFYRQCDLTPNNVAIISPTGKEMSYNDLRKSIQEKSNALEKLINSSILRSLPKAIPICLDFNEQIEWMLAVLSLGLPYCPLDPENSNSINEEIIFQLNPEVISNIYGDSTVHNTVSKIKKKSKLMYILFTSGSTGFPKGVQVENDQVLKFLNSSKIDFEINENSTVGHSVNTIFDVSVFNIFSALTSGATVRQFSSLRNVVEETFEKDFLSHLFLTSAVFNSLDDYSISKLSKLKNLRYLIVGGETPKTESMKRFNSSNTATLAQIYGPTEATVWVTVEKYIVGDTKIDPEIIGKEISGAEIFFVSGSKILSKNSRAVGEMCLTGNIVRGYLDTVESEEREKFFFFKDPVSEKIKKCFASGDYGKRMEDGRILFIGRKKGFLKRYGMRIDPFLISNKIKEIGRFRDCTVTQEDIESDKVLVAFV